MKIIVCLLSLLGLLITVGCEEEHGHYRHHPYGGAYDGHYEGYGHGDYHHDGDDFWHHDRD